MQHLSPNVIDLINQFNRVASWVCTAIVLEKKLKVRVEIEAMMIKIAHVCKYWTQRR